MGSSYARPHTRNCEHLTFDVSCSSSCQFSFVGMMLVFEAETITLKNVLKVHLEYVVSTGFATRGRNSV
jgi:hypothetical protein